MKTYMRVIAAVLIGCATVSFCGCQANPEKPVVVSKGDGAFDINAAVSASETHAPDATQAAKYSDTFTSTDGSVEYVVSIDETVTGADMPVVEVAPYFLTEQDAKRAAEAFFGSDAVFYDTEPMNSDLLSKSEIQEKLNRWSRFTSDESIAELFGPYFNEGTKDIVKRFIEDYTRKYEAATEENLHTPCQWTYRKSMEYFLLPEELIGRDLSDDNDEISAQVTANGIPYVYTVSKRDMNDCKISMVTLSITGGISPSDLDTRYYYAKLCRTDKPSSSQIEAIRESAAKMLADVGLGQWMIDRCYVETTYYGEIPQYIVHVDAVPVLNNTPALRQPQLTNLESEKAYAANYYLTDALLEFSANGSLIHAMLYSPLEIQNVINNNVSVKEFDELMALAKRQLQLRDDHSFSFGYFTDGIEEDVGCTVTVSELKYNLVRVKVPNTDQRYYYVPGVTFRGTVEYYGKDTGNIYYASDAPETLVALNAVDGSVISLTNE